MTEQSSLTVASKDQLELSPAAAYGLVGTRAGAPFRAEPIPLSRSTTSAQALVIIATSCLRQIALNENGVREGSAEAVHQMRVGLRRLRAAFSIFGSILGQGEFDALKRELVWLTEQLAEARECDVLLQSRRRFEDATGAALGVEQELSEQLARRRERAFAVARGAVQVERFQRLIVSAAACLVSRADREGKGAEPAHHLARRILEHRRRRVLRGLARFEQLSEGERHKLRVRIKKLRYGTEFFATLFSRRDRRRKSFSRRLEALQDALGRLNDISVQRALARSLVDEDRSSRRSAFALGALIGFEHAELGALLVTVSKLRRRLARAPRFWR